MSPKPHPLSDTLTRRSPRLEADTRLRRQRIGVAARHHDLLDLVSGRIEGRFYEDKLGLLHQVGSDLAQLTDALLTDAPGVGRQTLFPRGDPRIFLLIDDLDRCPPPKVVQVLEAAQLLVKTRLFVVIVAMDVRYVTRALEREYAGVLTRGGEPSGFDYIEKIIQIPYRVRPASQQAVEGFLRHEMGVIDEPTERPESAPDPSEAEPPLDEESADASTIAFQQREPEPRYLATAQVTRSELSVLPTLPVDFDADDHRLISGCCAGTDVSPRTVKRLVNVLRLLKIIWYRRGLNNGPAEPVKQMILATLVLAARHPEVTRDLIHALERRFASLQQLEDELVPFLRHRCRQRSTDALVPSDWEEVIEMLSDKRLFPQDITLAELGEENMRLVGSVFARWRERSDPRGCATPIRHGSWARSPALRDR